ncbi:DUF11 domain-containing protein [Laspinema palackyanum]|uniref:DUF11 domain-containing protein n=1 Tax=Laspinema palackyanum TaxID=3231601 RepID=UPI00345CA569
MECDPTPGRLNAAACSTARTGGAGPTAPQDNNDFFMRYVDTDGNSNTFNSSSATLALPAEVTGTDVLWAGLYWGADLQHTTVTNPPEQITRSPGCQNAGITAINSGGDYQRCQANRVLLQTPASGGYVSITADQFDFESYGPGGIGGIGGRGRRYQGIANVTNLVRAGGAGAYTVGNIQASSGISQSGPYGGWGLVIVYRDPNSPFGRIIVYDGFAFVSNSQCLAINVTGFQTPLAGNFAARLGMIAYEGDRAQRFQGDTFELNNNPLSDASNPSNNFFNSSITGPSTNTRTPNYVNNFGFDSDNLVINDAQNIFGNNATSANVRVCTRDDGYSPGLLTFSAQTQVADLSLSKTVDNPTPNPGSNVTFRLTLTNDGPDNATNVEVSDQLPAGLTFVSATASQGIYDNSTGIWTVGPVANQGVATLDIVATVTTPEPIPEPIVNTAEVSASDQPDIDSTPNNNILSEDDQASVVINGQNVDLSLTKTVDNATPLLGQNVTFTITLNNSGPGNATGVEVRDQLPAGLNFVSSTPTLGTYDSKTGLWTVGTVSNGGSATLTIVATVTTSLAVINTAEVIATNETDTDSIPGNNNLNEDDQASSVPVIAQESDLSLRKSVDNLNPTVGDTIAYTVTLTNNGPSDATGVQITDQLPAGLTYISDNSGGAYNRTTGLWTVGNLANGATITLTVSARVDTVNEVINTASITASDQPDPNNSNNRGTVTIPQQQADLKVQKIVDNPNPNLGDIVTYTISVVNNGPNNATNVSIVEQLPTGLTFISSEPSLGTYNESTKIWTIGRINTGNTVTLTIRARVDTLNESTNTASINSSDQVDPDITNNQSSVTIPQQQADLEVQKIVDQSTPRVGETITYTISVKNNGPSNATNVSITDQLPPGLTFVSASPNQGNYNNSTGIWTMDRLDNGETATLQIAAIVRLNETITNVAQVSGSDQLDPSQTNNQDNEVIVPVAVPNLELLKRITRINGTVVGQSESLTNWPANFVRGLPNSNTIQPGDEVEYTIYFLSAGSGPLDNARVCDPLQNYQTFRTDTFNGQTPTEGAFGAEVGIALALNPPNPDLPTAYLRSANSESNRGRFYPSGITAPPVCRLPNVRGAVVVDIGNLAAGDYGFIRFRVRID